MRKRRHYSSRLCTPRLRQCRGVRCPLTVAGVGVEPLELVERLRVEDVRRLELLGAAPGGGRAAYCRIRPGSGASLARWLLGYGVVGALWQQLWGVMGGRRRAGGVAARVRQHLPAAQAPRAEGGRVAPQRLRVGRDSGRGGEGGCVTSSRSPALRQNRRWALGGA